MKIISHVKAILILAAFGMELLSIGAPASVKTVLTPFDIEQKNITRIICQTFPKLNNEKKYVNIKITGSNGKSLSVKSSSFKDKISINIKTLKDFSKKIKSTSGIIEVKIPFKNVSCWANILYEGKESNTVYLGSDKSDNTTSTATYLRVGDIYNKNPIQVRLHGATENKSIPAVHFITRYYIVSSDPVPAIGRAPIFSLERDDVEPNSCDPTNFVTEYIGITKKPAKFFAVFSQKQKDGKTNYYAGDDVLSYVEKWLAVNNTNQC